MAYPDGTAVIRYYPVELVEGSWHTNGDAQIGLGLWFEPDYPYEPTAYTLASLDGDPIDWSWDQPGAVWLTSLTIPVAPAGEYSERAFVLVDPSNNVVPLTAADLPIELYVSRSMSGDGGYAGGVVQVGLYQGGAFVPLASFQLSGFYFPGDQVAPDGWEQLPPIDPASIIEDYPQPRVRLEGDLPVPLFWTQFKQAVEV